MNALLSPDAKKTQLLLYWSHHLPGSYLYCWWPGGAAGNMDRIMLLTSVTHTQNESKWKGIRNSESNFQLFFPAFSPGTSCCPLVFRMAGANPSWRWCLRAVLLQGVLLVLLSEPSEHTPGITATMKIPTTPLKTFSFW